MRGDGMMLTDAQQRDFLTIFFDWLNQEPRGVWMRPDPTLPHYAITLHAVGTQDEWRLQCHFVRPPYPGDGYDGDFCVRKEPGRRAARSPIGRSSASMTKMPEP